MRFPGSKTPIQSAITGSSLVGHPSSTTQRRALQFGADPIAKSDHAAGIDAENMHPSQIALAKESLKPTSRTSASSPTSSGNGRALPEDDSTNSLSTSPFHLRAGGRMSDSVARCLPPTVREAYLAPCFLTICFSTNAQNTLACNDFDVGVGLCPSCERLFCSLCCARLVNALKDSSTGVSRCEGEGDANSHDGQQPLFREDQAEETEEDTEGKEDGEEVQADEAKPEEQREEEEEEAGESELLTSDSAQPDDASHSPKDRIQNVWADLSPAASPLVLGMPSARKRLIEISPVSSMVVSLPADDTAPADDAECRLPPPAQDGML